MAKKKKAGKRTPHDQLTIEHVPIDSIRLADRNARLHSDAQIDQVAAAIRDFGWTNPIVTDENLQIIAGHGRRLAALKLGYKTAPVIRVTGLTDAQKRALAIADNKLGLNSSWDADILQQEVQELAALDELDMGLLGFNEIELSRMLSSGAPQGPQMSQAFAYKVIVDCTDQVHQGELIERLEKEGLVCHPLIS